MIRARLDDPDLQQREKKKKKKKLGGVCESIDGPTIELL